MIRELVRAAFVIARRDFTATVFSRAFLLFLLGPLFPVLLGGTFGAIGGSMASPAEQPTIAVVGSDADYDTLAAARHRLSSALDTTRLIALRRVEPAPDAEAQRARLLASQSTPVVAVLEGGLAHPRLTGAVNPDGTTVRQVRLLIDSARRGDAETGAAVEFVRTKLNRGSLAPARALTARAGQALLFLLTLLLAGMLLSQLIEEKSNKVIEVLAAAVPIDAIFVGKLFAMLAMSMLGITVWTAAGAAGIAAIAENGLAALPPPAVGWPAFLVLGLLYFAMSYCLLGSVFLGIGAQASTVREVQTLSMPVTMAQVVLFAIASTAVGQFDSTRTLAGAVFPLSSPFVMIARAAERPEIWPHLLALIWQLLWVGVIVHLAAGLFRRSVLKSGGARPFWRRRARA